MGYYSTYRLEVIDVSKKEHPAIEEAIIKEITKKLQEISHYDMEYNDQTIEPDDNPVKWYDANKDMHKLAMQYPQYLFTLDREGEGQGDGEGDFERSYFRGQFYQETQAYLVYPPMNPNLGVDQEQYEKFIKENPDKLEVHS